MNTHLIREMLERLPNMLKWIIDLAIEEGWAFCVAHSHTMNVRSYGGNGLTYSMIGAGLLNINIEQRVQPLVELVSFFRLD